MAHPRYVCIHGHFYQPPRENPWLDVVEVQDSAAPFHDWNERITRECYAPNTRARLVGPRGQIINLLNNYAWISYNFGPTLLSWMEAHAPGVLAELVEADALSAGRRGGHGNALAQVYNHMILPTACDRDRRTQVLWGVADFRRRFGRDPEGMWLPETAADTASLEALAEAGVKFTVLAPHQARRWRKVGASEWTELPGGVDPSRAYLVNLPSGRSIAAFFYDGAVSRQVAFERLLDNGEKFLAALRRGFDDRRDHAQLMHIATDGESYGHHHAHGDMALAYVIDRLARDPDVRLTNYGEFLALHPPAWEAQIHERTSWSCAHGVGRWTEDCGCKMRGDWHQRWRGPLRQALDGLREQLDHLFGTRGRECFPDPWAARDGYIEVVLDRSQPTVRRFLQTHGHPDLDAEQTRDALRLLEMQRDGMLMYTSCGWFFDEVSGIETVQCLQYASRAMHLARHFGRDYESKFLEALDAAPSNLSEYRDGRGVWDRLVRPAVVDLDRALAHSAIALIYPAAAEPPRTYGFDLEVLDHEVRGRGGSHLAFGRMRVSSRRTWETSEAVFVVIHYGGLDFHTVLSEPRSPEEYESLRSRVVDAYVGGSLADVTTLVAQEFGGRTHRLADLFADEQRRVISIVLEDRVEDYQRTFERLSRQDDDVLHRLGLMGLPVPRPLRATASSYLDQRLGLEIRLLDEGRGIDHIRDLLGRARAWGYQPDAEQLGKALTQGLRNALASLEVSADPTGVLARAGHLLDAASLLDIRPDLWDVQNQLLDAHLRLSQAGALGDALRLTLSELAEKLNVSPGLLGWRP